MKYCVIDAVKSKLAAKDNAYMAGLDITFTTQFTVGKTSFYDDREMYTLPLDPRKWLNKVDYIRYDVEHARNVILYTDDDIKEIPLVRASGTARVITPGASGQYQVVMRYEPSNTGCGVFQDNVIRAYEKGSGHTILIPKKTGTCTAAMENF